MPENSTKDPQKPSWTEPVSNNGKTLSTQAGSIQEYVETARVVGFQGGLGSLVINES